MPFAQVWFLGERRGEITDAEGSALIPRVPIGMTRVRVNAYMNNPAVDSVMVQEGKLDTLRFRLEPLLPSPPVASSVEEVLSDTARGSARLIVRLRPSPKCDVRVTVRRNGLLVRAKELLWDHRDHGDRAAFQDLSYGTYEVEAKGILRKRKNFLQFQYWKGAAKKTVILEPQPRGNTQRASLRLRWTYGGWGSYTVTVD